MCPADYHYSPRLFDRPPELTVEALYVVGGLYGNLAALDAVEALAAAEGARVTIVFNGDFHWFDAEPGWFAEIEWRLARHRATRGNVETEIAREHDIGAGCGCAYPPDIADDMVNRSNAILAELRRTAATVPGTAARLADLPMHLVLRVGALAVAIVHGDATSLAGWRFAPDALDDAGTLPWLDGVRRTSGIDVFASTHTCLAALRDLMLPGGRLSIINNGAAGMPNFSRSRFGLFTRIATSPSPHRVLYGLERQGVHIDAIALAYHHRAFADRFLERWPAGSPAHASYFMRISAGPNYEIARARGA